MYPDGTELSPRSVGGPGVDSVEPMPARGDLHIKERRSWKTWQLVTGMVIAVLIGMAIDYNSPSSNSATAASKSAYALPPPSGNAATTSSTASAPSTSSSGSTTTTTTTMTPAASGSATTTATTTTAAGSTATTAADGPAQTLLAAHQSTGNWTSTTFTPTAAGWNIGWAYQCTPAPASGPSFQVFVTTPGGTATGTPAVNETGASGQSATSQTSTGAQILIVQAPANCEWVVKVTGT
jgi:hypothetical protein